MLKENKTKSHHHAHCRCSPIFGFDVFISQLLSFKCFLFIQDYVDIIYNFTCPAFTFRLISLSYGHYWVVVFPICTLKRGHVLNGDFCQINKDYVNTH